MKWSTEEARLLRSEARKVWELLTGEPVPEGMQVHHRHQLQDAHLFPEEYPNDPSNLQLIDEASHSQLHGADRQILEGRPRTRQNIEFLTGALDDIFKDVLKSLTSGTRLPKR